MNYYNITNLDNNIVLATVVIKEYTEEKLSLQKIAIKHRKTIHIIRQILIDNGITLREGNKKINN
jgi:hypothetical protein